MNYEYCATITYRDQIPDKIEFARKLIEMCRENEYRTIKFATDVRGYPLGAKKELLLHGLFIYFTTAPGTF